MSYAETLMEEHPDSAMSVLERIDCAALNSRAERARYALLMSMALDKNYIDTTSFEVLRPAIDYYLDNGNPDDILKTYYYQGRIYQNRGDLNNALSYFAKAVYSAPGCTDSLAIARALVAQGGLYRDFQDINAYTRSYLAAYNIYKGRRCKDYESANLLHALNGAIILEDKNLTDSIFDLFGDSARVDSTLNNTLQSYRLTYVVRYGSREDIKDLLEHQASEAIDYDADGILNLAYAKNMIGSHREAKELLEILEHSGMDYNTLKFQSIKFHVCDSLNEYKEALNAYMACMQRYDSINIFKFNQKIESINERHELELKARREQEHKDKVIWSWVGVCIVLGLCIFILLLLVRNHKAKKDLAMQRAKVAEAEKEELANRVEALEEESENLKGIMEANELPAEVRQAMQVRLEMLNSFFASRISDNDRYGQPYEAWVDELTANAEEFMNSNRLAFYALYPRFIQYFVDHGLTEDEMNLVCLYAIGLKGKEVGAYTKRRSYANISSAIRKKLGIDQHETNIGIYVRKLLREL